MCPLGGPLLGHRGLRGRVIAHVLVLETSRDGLVLIDTGFGTRDVTGATRISAPLFRAVVGPRFERSETALAQIQGLGFAATDVRHVVVTHLDLDHAGGISDFPSATIHVHAREHAAAMTRALVREKTRYLPAHWAHGPRWEVYREDGDTWRGLPAVTRLRGLDADVALVPMHGHTRGHSAVVVRTAARWLVHAGDAYFHRASLDGAGRVPLALAALERLWGIDSAARRASIAALRQLHASYSDLDVFCAHDERELRALRGSS
jgi:glyoxylase-like metal-dependent hydrolase (beta-lactamase superfamily II)